MVLPPSPCGTSPTEGREQPPKVPLTGENVKPDEEDGHLDRTERVDDEPDAEDGGELQRHRPGRGCRPPSSRRRSAGWPPHLASCGAPATRSAADTLLPSAHTSRLTMQVCQSGAQGADASARRCAAGRGGAEQTTYGRRALADAPPPPSASSSSPSPSKTADDFGSMRSRMACVASTSAA